jgi:cell division protein FtsL
MGNYGYQYGTSPRKIKFEEDTPKKKSPKKPKKNNAKKPKIKSKKLKEKIKAKETVTARINFVILMVITIGCILFIMYNNVKINEAFAEVQTLTKTVSSLEKENSQILVNIQNNLNLSNIENIATSTLGMQKLSSKQTVYISLDTKDYTEITTKAIQKDEEQGFFTKIISKLKNLF